MRGDAGDNRGQDDDGEYYDKLFNGSQQPPDEPEADASPEPDGAIVRGDREELGTRFRSDMRRKLPEGLAELIVSESPPGADGKPRFGLRVACCCTRVKKLLVEYGRPALDPGRRIAPTEESLLPSEFLDAMGKWSYDQTEFVEWLNHRRHAHPDKFELVVWDDTGYRIPWELLWVPAKRRSGLPSGYLGALVTVTRWVKMKPYWPEQVRPFTNPNPYRANGPVVAYIASDMTEDWALLQDFRVEPAGGMDALFTILGGDPDPLAMVYVACHGEFDDDNPGDSKLGGVPLGRMSRYNDDFPRLSDQSTLVVLNGCRTGSIGVDAGKYNDGALSGFAAVFLRCGASGVLATTGAVGMKEAREVADALFKQLRLEPDRSVPDAVRGLRADAAVAIDRLLHSYESDEERASADAALRPLLHPFMYVYFGSPRMVMSFAPRDGLAGTAVTGA